MQSTICTNLIRTILPILELNYLGYKIEHRTLLIDRLSKWKFSPVVYKCKLSANRDAMIEQLTGYPVVIK